METVCNGKHWDVLLAENNGRIEGALPYLFGKKFGLRFILQPQLTQFCGPWYNLPEGEDSTAFERRIGDELSRQLDRQHIALFLQHFSPTVTDCTPFIQRGYHMRQRYTYRFDPIPAPSLLPTLAAKDRRRGTEAVREAYQLDKTVDIDEFVDFHIGYWERRSGKDLLSRDFLRRIVTTALNHQQALLYGLRDNEGHLMAARFVVYDKHCAHSLLSALHPTALRNTMTVLTWYLIADLHDLTTIYDFEGSMDPGIAHFYRSFGSTRISYFEITRYRPWILKFLLR